MLTSVLLAMLLGTNVARPLLGTNVARPLLGTVSYASATITDSRSAEVASLLAVSYSSVDTGVLTTEQKNVWTDLVARVESQYGAADRRQRARLTVEMLKLQEPGSARTDDSIWLRFPDGTVTRGERVSYPRSGEIWRLYDPGTGQYLAIVRSGDTSDLAALFSELLKHASDDSVARVREATARSEAQIEAVIEINGQRQYLAKGTATPGALGAELMALFPNLFDDGKQRILQSLALLEALRAGTIKAENPNLVTAAHLCAAPVDPAALPLPTVPETLRVRVTANRSGFLEPPDEATVTPFFGRAGWQEPDLARDFKEQVRKLLSSSN
jgi:hypothetical protein